MCLSRVVLVLVVTECSRALYGVSGTGSNRTGVSLAPNWAGVSLAPGMMRPATQTGFQPGSREVWSIFSSSTRSGALTTLPEPTTEPRVTQEPHLIKCLRLALENDTFVSCNTFSLANEQAEPSIDRVDERQDS